MTITQTVTGDGALREWKHRNQATRAPVLLDIPAGYVKVINYTLCWAAFHEHFMYDITTLVIQKSVFA